MIAAALAAVIPVMITTGELAAAATPTATSVQPIEMPPITIVPLRPPAAPSTGAPGRNPEIASAFQAGSGIVTVLVPEPQSIEPSRPPRSDNTWALRPARAQLCAPPALLLDPPLSPPPLTPRPGADWSHPISAVGSG